MKDKEPKFGLVVIGPVNPRKMLSKGGLKIGDALVLTKPAGFRSQPRIETRTSGR
ncbi:MAG: hypothetical protein U0V48_02945 [Anaerolineales bacterium]